MKHWASQFIGKPWEADATGPHSYDCRGLVAACCMLRLSAELPAVDKIASSHWKRTTGRIQADDVVLMQGPSGRHIGFMVAADGKLLVLHSDGHQTAHGPVGGVVAQPVDEAVSGGYHDYEFWRLMC